MGLTVLAFDDELNLHTLEGLDSISEMPSSTLIWVDLETDDFTQLTEVASYFNLHELSIEDCLTAGHYPKIEDFGSYLFMIFRGLRSPSEVEEIWARDNEEAIPEGEEDSYDVLTRKVAIYLSQNFIVTYRRKEVQWLDALVRQVQQNPGRHLQEGADGIAHRVIDVLIDRFMRGFGFFETMIENIEDDAFEKPEGFEVSDLFDIKRELSTLRQISRNQRAVIARLATDQTLIQDTQHRRYFKDIDDHCAEILRQLDKGIQDLASIRDTYIALSNVRLGDTMRVLTVITTVAAPMNIVVGLYGMNFAVVPLIHNPLGFWFILILMLSLGLLMLVYFRKNKWI